MRILERGPLLFLLRIGKNVSALCYKNHRKENLMYTKIMSGVLASASVVSLILFFGPEFPPFPNWAFILSSQIFGVGSIVLTALIPSEEQ